MKKIIAVILLCTVSIVTASSARADLPTTISSEQKLQEEIRKIITAGHLRPAYFNETEYWTGITHKEGTIHTGMFDYWSNPAETTYVLIRALPYLPDTPYPDDPGKSWKEKTKDYIQIEWNLCRPDMNTHCGWENGAAREVFDLPPEAYQEYATVIVNRKQPGTYIIWKKWATAPYTFHPFNFYAAWLYAKEFGGAGTILTTMYQKIKPFPTDEEMLQNNLHVVNAYIAGYYGFLSLYELAGSPTTNPMLVDKVAEVQASLPIALAKRVELLDIPPHEIRGTDQGGFLYLVPELAQHLRQNQNALAKVQNQVQTHNSYSAPYWFVANMDEVQRLTDEYIDPLPLLTPTPLPPTPTPTRISGGEEGATSTYYAYWSLFQAKAQILQESRAELEKYLDVPAVERGDLYYIDNLISTLEASGDVGPTPTIPPNRTLGDVNDDGDVNLTDLSTLLSSFGTSIASNTGADFNGDGNVNIADLSTLLANFGS
ncbi:hypothetical protein HY469_02135 [Candidatus Roizmanbacteria bacterium]|nr:hypothetical protein [Candidatus Roizmanbacteria bacterium]